MMGRVQKQSTGANSLYLPIHVARAIPRDATFKAELTEEGVLFRFVGIVPREETPPTSDLPEWAQS